MTTIDDLIPAVRVAIDKRADRAWTADLAPPGDIHRIRNTATRTAISLHIYGTDTGRIGSSARRYYN